MDRSIYYNSKKFKLNGKEMPPEDVIDELVKELQKLKTLIANHRVDYIDGKDLELITHEMYEAVGFEPLYGGAKAIKEEDKCENGHHTRG